jgi:hypothetical protein
MSSVRLMATRVELDRSRPCLACGAPWRLVSESSDIRDASDPAAATQVVIWRPIRGDCSANCWEQDRHAYEVGLMERELRGWLRP